MTHLLTSLQSIAGVFLFLVIGYLLVFSEVSASVAGYTGCSIVVHERDDGSLYIDHALQLARFKWDGFDGSLYTRINTVRCKAITANAGYEVGRSLNEQEEELVRKKIRNYKRGRIPVVSGFPAGFIIGYGGGSPITSPGYFLGDPFTPHKVDPQYQENPGPWAKFVNRWHRIVLFFWTPRSIMFF